MKLCDGPPQISGYVYDNASLKEAKKFVKEIQFRSGNAKCGNLINSKIQVPMEKRGRN
jgi:hypothetical protein